MMNKFKKAIKAFCDTLFSNEIDAKMFKRKIYNFYTGRDNYSVMLTITDVKVYETEKEYTIQITTHTPGLIIGRGGQLIDEMINYIQQSFEKSVKIDLQESRLWDNVYS